MTAKVFRLVTGATTNLTLVKQGQTNVKGIIATNTAAYAIFVKLYWVAPNAVAPTVGTTLPDVTITMPAAATSGGGTHMSFSDGFTKNTGNLYMAVTKLAADNDTTVVVAGDGLITLLYE